ncbi:MAG: Na/Pi symporter [Candidatus Tritonobacter lacicola]|nr:Na/Pi symporter [Candidatus Tritonobacter lacicola]
MRHNRSKTIIPLLILGTFILASAGTGKEEAEKEIANLTYKPGQFEISAIVDTSLAKKISVKVTRDGKPVAGEKIYFSFTAKPSKSEGAAIESEVVSSGPDGVASTGVTVGDKPGMYHIAAFAPGIRGSPVVFSISAHKTTWLFFIVMYLLGGQAIFLYGMFHMSENMQKFGGHGLENLIEKCTSNRFKALFVGTLVTAIIQSSSATTVMVVGLINGGLMQFSQSIGIILGANIGTTITAQIVAFKLTDYALMFVFIGFLVKFVSSGKKKKLIGDIILGFGLLFFGMKIMADSTKPLRTYQPFIDLLLNLENPVIGVLVGGIFTGIIRSSSAATGVYIALSFQGLMPLEAAIPLIFGANIGTSTNALIASIGGCREAKRAALVHVIFNMAKVCCFLPFISGYRNLVYKISPHPAIWNGTMDQIAQYGPRMIANAHTMSKVIAVAVAVPFTPLLAKLCKLILPVTEKEKRFRPKYLNEELLKMPDAALSVTKKEVLRMGGYTLMMIDRIMEVMKGKKAEWLDEIVLDDEKIDILYKEIRPYLSKITQRELDVEASIREAEIVIVAEELENIGDVISKSLISSMSKFVEYDLFFTKHDWEHIIDFHGRIKDTLNSAREAFRDDDLEKAQRIAASKEEMAIYYKALHIAHLQKFHSGVEQTIQMSTLYLNILADFRQLHSLAVNIANAVIDFKTALGK